MRFAVAAVAAGLAGVAVAQNATASDVYVTEVVTAYTTFCPEATKITHAGQTYTVSEATTLTITNCPGGCTVTKPAYSSPAAPVSASSSAAVVPSPYTSAAASSSAPVAPVPYTSSMATSAAPSAGVPYPSSNGTVPAYSSGAAAGTASASASSTAAPYTGAAGKSFVATGAGVLALFGLVAAI